MCYSCIPPCFTCSVLLTNCTSCVSPNYLMASNNTCLSNCPSGYATNINTSACDSCNIVCSTCFGSTINECIACKNVSGINYYLNNTSCLANCPSGFYNDSISNLCIACTAPCANCSINPTNCTSCINSSYILVITTCTICTAPCVTCFNTLTNCTSCNTTTFYVALNNTCPASCPSGYAQNTSTRTCDLCYTGCLTCTNASSNGCTACTNVSGTNYYLNGTTCLLSCPSGSYNNTANSCAVCTAPCSTCSLTGTNCTSCVTGYILSVNTCSICTAPCATCSNILSNCTSCTAGTYYLSIGNTCPATCPVGYYSNATTKNCDNCYLGCSACTTPLINGCTACANVSGTVYFLNSSTCFTSCPSGTYNNTPNACAPCVNPCVTCSILSTNCTSCNSTTFLMQSLNTCPASCSAGYIGNATTRICDTCYLGCSTCTNTSSDGCTACKNVSGTVYYLNGTTCITSCGAGYYNNTPNACALCTAPCNTCTGTATYCLTCNTGYLLNINTCVICTDPCATCSNTLTNCTSCNSTTFLIYLSNTCSATCTGAFVANAMTRTCDPCYIGCLTCTNSSSNGCSTCTNVSGTVYYLSGTSCLTSCPSGFYNNTPNGCAACTAPCLTSVNTATNCTSCVTNAYFLVGNTCTLCTAPCVTCSLALNNCTSCNGTTFFMASSNTCPTTCPAGFAGNTSTRVCDSCYIGCATCTNGSINRCSTCKSVSGTVYYLNGTFCLTACPTGFYNNTPNGCAICNVACSICFGTSTNCSSCVNSSYILDTNTCTLCPAPCVKCSGSISNCIQCNPTTFLYSVNTSCLSVCPATYVQNTSTRTCDSCYLGCLNCTGINFNQCVTCNNISTLIYYFYASTCIINCPSGYVGNVIGNICNACLAPCVTCSNNQNNCTSCNTTTYYISNSC